MVKESCALVNKTSDSSHNSLFNHYIDLYISPSRLLLRSAPKPSIAKINSFEVRIEHIGVDPG